jgi:hypothetical protein
MATDGAAIPANHLRASSSPSRARTKDALRSFSVVGRFSCSVLEMATDGAAIPANHLRASSSPSRARTKDALRSLSVGPVSDRTIAPLTPNSPSASPPLAGEPLQDASSPPLQGGWPTLAEP